MKRAEPVGFSRRRVQQLLSSINDKHTIGDRIEAVSRKFLGCPYKTNPLIGSVDHPEVFTASLAAFDCVTYIETVVAIARASEADHVVECLRRIRYKDGRVEWSRRNHYMIDWIRNNVRNGVITPVSLRGVPTVARQRRLSVIPELPVRRIQLKCVAKRAVPIVEPRLQTGDLIWFASTRPNLDVFHAGIVVRNGWRAGTPARRGSKLLLRHASRSKGGVVEQELRDFLRENRMAGVILMRPRTGNA